MKFKFMSDVNYFNKMIANGSMVINIPTKNRIFEVARGLAKAIKIPYNYKIYNRLFEICASETIFYITIGSWNEYIAKAIERFATTKDCDTFFSSNKNPYFADTSEKNREFLDRLLADENIEYILKQVEASPYKDEVYKKIIVNVTEIDDVEKVVTLRENEFTRLLMLIIEEIFNFFDIKAEDPTDLSSYTAAKAAIFEVNNSQIVNCLKRLITYLERFDKQDYKNYSLAAETFSPTRLVNFTKSAKDYYAALVSNTSIDPENEGEENK